VSLVLDSGVVFAALDRRDRHHATCSELLVGTREALVIPAPVLVEVDYWVRKALGNDVLLRFLEDVAAGTFRVANLEPADYHRIRAICGQYADSDIGLVDASVLAVVERLNEPKLATIDRRHFAMLRPAHVASLVLLPVDL
jgi:hypothetical protein